jgi:hypothetical protein
MKNGPPGNALPAAMACAALMMAHHVGAKSVRDALFLSSFDVTSLPTMVIAAAGFSLLLALGASRLMRRWAPAVIVPRAFGAVALMYVLVAFLLPAYPRPAAVLVFLLVVGTGSLLTSGFWSLLNECLDPNAVRTYAGKVAAAGTAGVFVGGLVTERIGALWSITSMLPVLVLLHLLCAFAAHLLSRCPPSAPQEEPHHANPQPRTRLRDVLETAPYLMPLAFLVLAGTTTAGLIDYIFKSESAAAFGSREALLRFFAVFNAAIGLITFLLQTSASRSLLARMGIGKCLATLPASAAVGSFLALVFPGLHAVAAVRGAEALLRGSLFRIGYELFYAPVPASAKRAAKPVLDVGFDRLGDGLAGVLVRVILFAIPALAHQAILSAAVLLAVAGIWITLRLEQAYVSALEDALLQRAGDLELSHFSGSIYGSLIAAKLAPDQLRDLPDAPQTADTLRDLLSGDPARARPALQHASPLDPLLVPAAINLLESDEVYPVAVHALRAVGARHTGQLTDRLLRSVEPLQVRRRIPRVLAHVPQQRSADGLILGLADPDFEVRFRCAQALSYLSSARPPPYFNPTAIQEAILREAARGQRDWLESRLMDADDPSLRAAEEEAIGELNDFSLEYVFALLSLLLPRGPLRVAFFGLHADDAHLRGTALEYLESVLAQDVRRALWPHLTGEAIAPAPGAVASRAGAAAEEELLRSEPSILLNLKRRRRE